MSNSIYWYDYALESYSAIAPALLYYVTSVSQLTILSIPSIAGGQNVSMEELYE